MKHEADRSGAAGAGEGAEAGGHDTGRRQFLQSCGVGLLHFIVLGGFSEPAEAAAQPYCNQQPATDQCVQNEEGDYCNQCTTDHNEIDKCACGKENTKDKTIDLCNCPKDIQYNRSKLAADVCECTDASQIDDYCQCTGDEAASVEDYCKCSDDIPDEKGAQGDVCTSLDTSDNIDTDECTVGSGAKAAADFCRCDGDVYVKEIDAQADICDCFSEGQEVDWCLCDSDLTGEADLCDCGEDKGDVDNCSCSNEDNCSDVW